MSKRDQDIGFDERGQHGYAVLRELAQAVLLSYFASLTGKTTVITIYQINTRSAGKPNDGDPTAGYTFLVIDQSSDAINLSLSE